MHRRRKLCVPWYVGLSPIKKKTTSNLGIHIHPGTTWLITSGWAYWALPIYSLLSNKWFRSRACLLYTSRCV